MTWQPIKTAPRDGRKIRMMNNKTGLIDIGYWCEYTNRDYKSLSGLDGEWDQEWGNGEMTHWEPMGGGEE